MLPAVTTKVAIGLALADCHVHAMIEINSKSAPFLMSLIISMLLYSLQY
jgi:hypothetical protein